MGAAIVDPINSLIINLVAYLIGRAAQHIGDTVNKRNKKWKIAENEFKELFKEAYRRFFQDAPRLVKNEEVKLKLQSPEIADNLLLYARGDLPENQVGYAFPPPFDRLPVILDELRKEGRPLSENYIISSLKRLEMKISKVDAGVGKVIDGQQEHNKKLDDLTQEVARLREGLVRTDYMDGIITRPWELHPSGNHLLGVPSEDKPFFDAVGKRLHEAAIHLKSELTTPQSIENQLYGLESEIKSKHIEWLKDPRRLKSERSASACLAFIYLQLGTIKFQNKDFPAAVNLYGQAHDHSAAACDAELAARSLYQKGVSLGIARRHREAEQAFSESLGLNDTPRARFNFALALHKQARLREAIPEYESALRSFRDPAKDDEASHLSDLATTLNNLGAVLSDLGERAGAQAAFEEALGIYRKLAEAEPAAFLQYVAITLNNLGNVLCDLGERAGARAAYEEALGIMRKLAEAEPAAFLQYVATTLNNLGTVLADLGERARARAAFEEALRIYRKLAEAEPAAFASDVAMTLNNLGTVLRDLGERAGAQAAFEEALGIYRKLAEAEPAVFLQYVATTLNNLGAVLHDLGAREEERAAYEEALAIWRELAEAEPAAFLERLMNTALNALELIQESGEEVSSWPALMEAMETISRLMPNNQ